MKPTLSLLILFACYIPCFSQKSVETIQEQISGFYDTNYFTVKYDKFKDVTNLSVRLDLTPKRKPLDFSNTTFNIIVGARFEGNGVSDKPKVRLLCVASSGKSLKFLKERELNLLVDTNRIALGEGNYDTDIDINIVLETLCWSLSEQQLQSILNAETFEFQLGEIESSIESEKLRLFKQYQKLLLPITPDTKTTFTLNDAVGKRKVLIETSDKESELKIAKELRKKNFEVVSELNSAEIIIRFGVEQTDAINFGQMLIERKWGKMSVYLYSNGKEGLIFTKSKKPSTFGQLLHKQAGDLTEDFIKALIKVENSK